MAAPAKGAKMVGGIVPASYFRVWPVYIKVHYAYTGAFPTASTNTAFGLKVVSSTGLVPNFVFWPEYMLVNWTCTGSFRTTRTKN